MNLPLKSSKIVLSPAEWGMAAQPDLILTKNRIITSVYEMFGHLAIEYRQFNELLAEKFPEVCTVPPKISRGEKYEDMPWVMLDYPRLFATSGHHFAIRSFFWWGHFFSIQLHVSGLYAKQLLPAMPTLAAMGWYTGCTADPWSHVLPNHQWQATSCFLEAEAQWPFLKAAKKIPIDRWETVSFFMEAQYQQLLQVIANTD